MRKIWLLVGLVVGIGILIICEAGRGPLTRTVRTRYAVVPSNADARTTSPTSSLLASLMSSRAPSTVPAVEASKLSIAVPAEKPTQTRTQTPHQINSLEMNRTHVRNKPMQSVNVTDYAKNIYFSIKTTSKFHGTRLPLLMLTWFQAVKDKVSSYFSLLHNKESLTMLYPAEIFIIVSHSHTAFSSKLGNHLAISCINYLLPYTYFMFQNICKFFQIIKL